MVDLILRVFWLDRRDILPWMMFDKENRKDKPLFNCNSNGGPSFTWLKRKIMLKSEFCCHSTLILYNFIVFFSNFQADFFYFFDNDFYLFLCILQSLFFPFLFYFISFFWTLRLIVLNFSISKFDSFSLFFFLFFIFKLLLFALLFQNQILDPFFILLISVILSWLFFILGYALKTKITSDFLFL